MILALDIRDLRVARAVLELQRVSYAVEAEIISSYELPPLSETLEELRECGEDFRGFFAGGTFAGAISTKKRGNTLDIHRLFVGPRCFRRGIGRSLLRSVEGDFEEITVSTGSENEPAKRLYLSRGFVEVGEEEVVPGLCVTRFEKRRTGV